MRLFIAIVALSAVSGLATLAWSAERSRQPTPAAAQSAADPEVTKRAAQGERDARIAIAQGKDRLQLSAGGGPPPRPEEVEPMRLHAEIPVQVMKKHGIEAVVSSSGCDMQTAHWQAAYATAYNAVMDAHLRKKRGADYRKAIDAEIAAQLSEALAALAKR
ncbi:hypothetical protein INH39_31655 [Massilia violaceinigra]|uniref:DUF4142 domain-containing protein n=1 Tax=Massilia violaceinigra TaxID=2045208 RepID=A0ABY4A796_9BURK|nr:hypothetical protein [Massilia violaceinigra]UOD29874.1 hypothetical protein INH39_31655 [Massilia violaceinigra]